MDSVSFCGRGVPHASWPRSSRPTRARPTRASAASSCHIGPGAAWFVKSKLSGVAAGLRRRASRPTRRRSRRRSTTCAPRGRRASSATGRSASRATGSSSRTSTPRTRRTRALTTVLLMQDRRRTYAGASVGIHGRHLDAGLADQLRGRRRAAARRSPHVTYRDDAGKIVEYVSTEIKATPEQLAQGETRTMDCVDCHNRPTHAFELPEPGPRQAITRAAPSAATCRSSRRRRSSSSRRSTRTRRRRRRRSRTG